MSKYVILAIAFVIALLLWFVFHPFNVVVFCIVVTVANDYLINKLLPLNEKSS